MTATNKAKEYGLPTASSINASARGGASSSTSTPSKLFYSTEERHGAKTASKFPSADLFATEV